MKLQLENKLFMQAYFSVQSFIVLLIKINRIDKMRQSNNFGHRRKSEKGKVKVSTALDRKCSG